MEQLRRKSADMQPSVFPEGNGPDVILAPLINAPSDRPYVIAQLGQSLDGRIATPTGDSRWINGSAALDHLHRLRANVDAVIVGAQTVIADDPALTVRRIEGRNPARVVIDANGRVPRTAKVFSGDGVKSYLVSADTNEDHDPQGDTEVIAVPIDAGGFCPKAIVAALAARGLKKILIEGGARTVSRFIDAGVVDRLHLLVAPVILGSGTVGISLKSIAKLEEARRPPTRVHVLDDGDVLFDCALT